MGVRSARAGRGTNSGGTGVYARLTQLRIASAAWLLCAALASLSRAGEPSADSQLSLPALLEAANERDSKVVAQIVPPAPTPRSSIVIQQEPVIPLPPTVTPTEIVPPMASPMQPLLDDSTPTEELLPSVVPEETYGRRGVRPYGGGHPSDWSWGCGGSPYRTGPGMCDDWRIGCRWHVAVDGIVLAREETDVGALQAQLEANDPSGVVGTPTREQFDRGAGGRVMLMSQVGRCVGWDLQVAYEGVPEWHSSIVYPKQTVPAPPFVIQPDPDTEPPPPFPERFEQRSLHYTSSLHSGALNFLPYMNPTWRPYFGVRYIKFDDEINDSFHQETQPPLPGPLGDADPMTVEDPIGPSHETDRLNIFDMENDLIGFQVGLFHDTWQVNRRLAFEGVYGGGVYYNRVKYTNLMGIFTTQTFADNTRSIDLGDGRTDFSNIVNNDVREYSEISYVVEASLTGVCRLNKCWALRGGYQMLWITNLHLAEDAYLGDENASDNLFFHGWHAGVECRR